MIMNVLIVGGGITGLTTALALNKVGINVKVYERANEFKAVGAGIWMSPNATKVLDWLGIGEQVRQQGMLLQSVAIADKKLKSLRKTDSQFFMDNDRNAIVAIHRAKLQEILYYNLDTEQVLLGKSYENHRLEGDKVIVKFEDGTEAKGDLLLGADGIHSNIRQQLFSNTTLRYSGQTCWRGVAKITLEEKYKAGGIEAWGKQIRFGFSAIGNDYIYWFAVAKAAEGEKEEGGETLKSKLLDKFGTHFAAPVADIIQQTPADKIIRNDISDLKRLKTWSKGRVCLLGDAGHATTPNMGQGGAQGIEDAYYISNILQQIPDYTKAFKVFEKERRQKVDGIVNNSWRFGKLAHGRFSQPLIKMLLKLTPEKLLVKQLQQVYSIPASFDDLKG